MKWCHMYILVIDIYPQNLSPYRDEQNCHFLLRKNENEQCNQLFAIVSSAVKIRNGFNEKYIVYPTNRIKSPSIPKATHNPFAYFIPVYLIEVAEYSDCAFPSESLD